MPESVHLHFDRGTLRLDGAAADRLPTVVWDERVSGWRAPAYRYTSIVDRARTLGTDLRDEIAPRIAASSGPWTMPELRPYQRDAMRSWRAFRNRGVVALPTGSGKTIVAAAALASTGVSSLILCPTRALLEQWERQLRRFFAGAIGVVGDGARRIEPVTVMTFESAYRQLDALGDRFGALVVDEAHHFAGGLRAEALEMCVAPVCLGLTATAPDAGSAGQRRLDELIGPLVCEVAVGELASRISSWSVSLSASSPTRPSPTLRDYRPFSELRSAFARANPEANWPSTIRAIARTASGRESIAAYHRAVALASFPRGQTIAFGHARRASPRGQVSHLHGEHR